MLIMTDEVPLLKNWLKGMDDVELATEFKQKSHRTSPEKVVEIKKALRGTKSLKQIAYECGVTYMTVYNINRRHTHKEK